MDRIYAIDDAQAFIRLPRGIHKQVGMYARGDKVLAPHGGGYVRICAHLGSDGWVTSCPNVRVIDFTPVPGLNMSREPAYHSTKETYP